MFVAVLAMCFMHACSEAQTSKPNFLLLRLHIFTNAPCFSQRQTYTPREDRQDAGSDLRSPARCKYQHIHVFSYFVFLASMSASAWERIWTPMLADRG